jgi:hypothetical protein
MSAQATAQPRSRAAIRQGWIDRLDRFTASRLTVAAFCRSEGVSCHAFYYWKHKLASQAQASPDDPPRLLPVRLLAQPSPVEVVLPHGAVLRVAPGCDMALVRSLVEALGEASC